MQSEGHAFAATAMTQCRPKNQDRMAHFQIFTSYLIFQARA